MDECASRRRRERNVSAIACVMQLQLQEDGAVRANGTAMMHALSSCKADHMHTWCNGRIYFGCYHQWVTEQAASELIPYVDKERRLVVCADVILDYREQLMDQLGVSPEERGRLGDAQLLALAYARWGEGCVQYLLGDYAFIIWDERKSQLFGARDLCGNRTLYYTQTDQRIYLSTTIGPLLMQEDVRKELELQWLAEYLTITGMHECTDARLTPYRHIYHLPPAHSFTVMDGQLSLRQYGTITPQEPLQLPSDEAYEEAFRDIVSKAVSTRLHARKKVGATLSGGLDSGTVVSFAARELARAGKKLHTFSFVPCEGFQDWTNRRLIADERPYIRATTQFVGNVEDHYFSFPDQHALTNTDDLLNILEAPYKFFGGIYWIKGIYEEAARRDVGVLLTGGRGNFTISWGPALDYYATLLKQFRWLRLLRELRQYSSRMQVGRQKLLSVVSRKAFPAVYGLLSRDAELTPSLIHEELARRTGVLERKGELEQSFDVLALNSFEERMRRFNNLANANKSGAVATKMSLKYGVWERDPTFDANVVRFCLAVPAEQYVRDGMDRALVRRSMRGLLPDDVLMNQTVRGVQAADWVSRLQPIWPQVIGELDQMCSDSAIDGLLNVTYIKSATDKFRHLIKPEHAFDPDMQYLIRSLIVYRYLKNWRKVI